SATSSRASDPAVAAAISRPVMGRPRRSRKSGRGSSMRFCKATTRPSSVRRAGGSPRGNGSQRRSMLARRGGGVSARLLARLAVGASFATIYTYLKNCVCDLAFGQPARRLRCMVCQDDIGASTLDTCQRLQCRLTLIEPAVGGRRLEHRVLAAHVVGGQRRVPTVAHTGQHV